MRNTILDDLIREIRRGDRKAIDLLLSDRKLTAVPKIASVVGWDRVGDFVREQLLRRVGSKNQSLSEWLESIPELTMTTWLVVRLKAHDTEVWNHWLQQNIDWLLKWTQSSVGVCPGHGGDASDVVQIAFAELARAIPRSISTYEQFLAFVRTILRRRAIDLSRKKLLTVLEQSSGDSTNRAPSLSGPRRRDPATSGLRFRDFLD